MLVFLCVVYILVEMQIFHLSFVLVRQKLNAVVL